MRILLVEDEDLLRTSLAHLLKRAGMEAQAVRTAAEALDVVTSFTPDILVTDWLLHGDCDGIELARRLRAALPGLRVIVITGLLAGEARAEIERDGIVAAFVEKPFQFAQLAQVLERVGAT